MARMKATEHVTSGGRKSERTLEELMPPLGAAEHAQYRADIEAIEASEQAALHMVYGATILRTGQMVGMQPGEWIVTGLF